MKKSRVFRGLIIPLVNSIQRLIITNRSKAKKIAVESLSIKVTTGSKVTYTQFWVMGIKMSKMTIALKETHCY